MPHINELIDWCASVYIVHKDKVLIRKHEKYQKWFHVGGHIELDENPIEAAKRECLEEVGLQVTIDGETIEQLDDLGTENLELPPPAHMNIHRINSVHQHIDLIYYATSESDQVVPENEDDEWLWLTAEEVKNHPEISEKIKYYALGALKKLGS